MDKSLRSALRLNNDGVQFLLENNDEEAQTCFNLSLDLVKQSLISNSKNQTRGGESTSSTSSPTRCMHQQSHSIPFLRSQDCFIYNKAISFILDDEDEDTILEEWYKNPEEKHVNDDDNCNNLHLYSAIIILNIALAYHRQAMIVSSLSSSSSHPPRRFQQGTTISRSAAAQEWRARAEKMYDMVTILLEDVDGDYDDNSDDDIVCATNTTTALLVKIAAVNNLSQLQREMGDYESSRDGFEYLGELIDFAEYHLKTTLLWNQEDTIMGMLLNVLLATSPEAAGAA